LPNITAENVTQWQQALQWYDGGLDVADAVHLASSKKQEDWQLSMKSSQSEQIGCYRNRFAWTME